MDNDVHMQAHTRLRKARRIPAILCIIVGVAAWIGDAEVLQASERYKVNGKAYDKPYFINYLIHCGYILWLGVWGLWRAVERCLSEDEGNAEDSLLLVDAARLQRKKPTKYYISLGWKLLLFNFLYLFGGYSWTISLPITSVAANTAIYNSSCIFVFVLSIFILKEQVSLYKVTAVFMSVGGIVMIAFAKQDPSKKQTTGTPFGYAALCFSTVAYAITEVLYGRYFAGQIGGHGRTKHEKRSLEIGSETTTVTSVNSMEAGETPQYIVEEFHRGLTGNASYYTPENIDISSSSKVNSNSTGDKDRKSTAAATTTTTTATTGGGKGMGTGTGEGGRIHTPYASQYGSGLMYGSGLSSGLNELDLWKREPYVKTLKDNLWFLGMLGVFNLLTCWPGMFVVDALGVESFELPDTHLLKSIFANIGLDAAFQAAFLTGIYLSSPLFMAVGLLLTIPTSIIVDKVVHDTLLPPVALGGVACIILGFILLNYAEYMIGEKKEGITGTQQVVIIQTSAGQHHGYKRTPPRSIGGKSSGGGQTNTKGGGGGGGGGRGNSSRSPANDHGSVTPSTSLGGPSPHSRSTGRNVKRKKRDSRATHEPLLHGHHKYQGSRTPYGQEDFVYSDGTSQHERKGWKEQR